MNEDVIFILNRDIFNNLSPEQILVPMNTELKKVRFNLKENKIVFNYHGTDFTIDKHWADAVSTEKLTNRQFESGANRNSDEGKFETTKFISYPVMQEYFKYMHKNRKLEDGTLRDGDNWQKGIPIDVYMSSMGRHFNDVWGNHTGYKTPEDQITNLSALLFNVMGMLHEEIKLRDDKDQK